MSDYLGNLITRTLSPEAVMRPQVPSRFELVPGVRQGKSGFDHEQETFSEPPQPTPQRKMSEPVSLTLSPPRKPVIAEPLAEIHRVDKAKQNVRGSDEPELSRENVVQVSAPSRESKPFPKPPEPGIEPIRLQTRKTAFNEDKLEMESARLRSDEADASAARPAIFKPQPRSDHPKSPASSKIIPAMQPVVPAVRSIPSIPRPPRQRVEQTINVTIGRVEIRATSPATPQRTRAKSANVLSLEDYLRQRANGGGR